MSNKIQRISPETLEAVKEGVLTDKQLKEALNHYRLLCKLLGAHGEKYHLVWLDAFQTLHTLEGFYQNRLQK